MLVFKLDKESVMKRILILLSLMVVISNSSFSQVPELDPVLISSSLQQKRIRETGRNIAILTKEDIKNIPANSLDELLRFVPGIEVQQRGPQGSQSDLIIRGGTFQQVLVVIDGMRANEPLTGHFNAYIPIHPEEIERIEVIKGAAAALFGPDAVGGVIHVITKAFVQEYAAKNKTVFAALQTGQYNLFNGKIGFAASNEKSYLSLGLQQQKAKGIPLRGTTGYFDNDLGTISYSRKLNKQWRLMLRGAADKRDFNAQNFYTSFLSDTANETVSSTWQQLALTKTAEKSSFTFLANARQLKDRYAFRPVAIPNQNSTSLLNIDARNSVRLKWQQARLTTGVQVFSKQIKSNDRGNHQHLHTGIYANLQHQLLKGLFLTEGIRADWDQSYKWALIPQLNLAYTGSIATLRASISKGIRDADFTERYNNYNKPVVTGGSIGNPALEAERSLNMEIGADLFLDKPIQLHATLFQRNQASLIDWVPTMYADIPLRPNLVPTGIYALASNIANVKTKGAELDLTGDHGLGKGTRLKWNTGITKLKSTGKDNTLPSFYLSSHARLLWNSNIRIMNKSGSISMGTVYKERNKQTANAINAAITTAYLTMNLRIEKYLFQKKAGLMIQVDNLTNKKYADLLGSIMPGRWMQAGVWTNLSR
jgi:iron complex outermembrane receptor protein